MVIVQTMPSNNRSASSANCLSSASLGMLAMRSVELILSRWSAGGVSMRERDIQGAVPCACHTGGSATPDGIFNACC